MLRTKALKGLACVAVLTLLAGCGESADVPKLAPVTGRVIKDGQPVEGARVSFVPEEGSSSNAVTDAEGRFELYYNAEEKGAVPGKHTVRISKMEGEAGEELIPPKFNMESTITKEVTKEGPNEFEIDISG